MPENITTVLNLPNADFGSGGFSNPADNRVYILQGEGSDRDRKVSLGDLFDWLVGAKAMTNESPQHRVGDIVFKIEDTRGGKILTAYVRSYVRLLDEQCLQTVESNNAFKRRVEHYQNWLVLD